MKVLTEGQRKAALLWLAAEGNEEARAAFPGQTLERIQLKFAESVASGELLPQLKPVLSATVREQFDTVVRTHTSFTTRNLMDVIGRQDYVDVFTPGDQDNIPEQNAGNRFVQGGLPVILPRQSYPQIGFEATGKSVTNRKHGEAFGVDWETIVNSRGAKVDLVRRMLVTLGRHAAQNEDLEVYKRFVQAGGFAAGLAEQGQAFAGNPAIDDPTVLPLLIQQLLETQVNGQDVDYSGFALVTSPSNAIAVRQTLATQSVQLLPGAEGGLSYAKAVDLGADVEVIGSKWINRIWGGSGIGRGFFLVPKAAADDLPVVVANYLRGYEAPQTFIRDANGRLAGGGDMNPLVDGDFDSDAMTTKVRHVFGSDLLWGEAIGFSLGTNA